MGQLRIVPGGLQLLGQALVLDSLFASSIKSKRGYPISVESSRNFTVSTRDAHGLLQSRLFLGEYLYSFSFKISDDYKTVYIDTLNKIKTQNKI